MESMQNNIILPGKLAELLGVSTSTLRLWDLNGTLVANRRPNGRKYYTQEHYDYIMTKHKVVEFPSEK